MTTPKANQETGTQIPGVNSKKCKCPEHAENPRNLIPRNDLGMTDGGVAKIALCVFAKPPKVHEWDGNEYVLREDLKFENNQVVDENGASVAEATAPTLADLDLDDDEAGSSGSRPQAPPRSGGSQPSQGSHVNLEDDEFYG